MNALEKKKREVKELRYVICDYESRHRSNFDSLIELARTTEVAERRAYILARAQRTHETLFTNLVRLRGW